LKLCLFGVQNCVYVAAERRSKKYGIVEFGFIYCNPANGKSVACNVSVTNSTKSFTFSSV